MELTEPVESINRQLVDQFGIDSISGLPIWRIIFSEDEFEKRHGTYDDISPAGIYIRTVTEVRLVPKYRQYIHQKYVLERLSIIPEINAADLPAEKLSYEPLYVFEDKKGNYLPPHFVAAKFIIDTVYAAQGKSSLRKYVDEEANNPLEATEARIKALEEELFGNESNVTDSLRYGDGIVVPSPQEN